MFRKILEMRLALNRTLKEQELRTAFPQRCTIIRVDGRFDNQMTLCLNGEEVMTCHADLRDIEGRDNRVESQMGKNHLLGAKSEFEKILKKSEQSAEIMRALDECIHIAAARPSLRSMSKRIDDILAKMPEP